MVYPPPSLRSHYLNYNENDGTSFFRQRDCFAAVEEPLKADERGLVCVYEWTESWHQSFLALMEMHRPVEVESSMRQSGRTGQKTYRQLYDTGNTYHFLPLPMRKRYSLTHKCYDWPIKKRDGGGACYYVDAEEKVAAIHMFQSHTTWRRRAIWLRKEIVLDYTSHHKKRALFVIVCDRFSERSLSDHGISETQETEHRGDRFKTWIKFSCDPTRYAKPLQQSSSRFVGKRDAMGD